MLIGLEDLTVWFFSSFSVLLGTVFLPENERAHLEREGAWHRLWDAPQEAQRTVASGGPACSPQTVIGVRPGCPQT